MTDIDFAMDSIKDLTMDFTMSLFVLKPHEIPSTLYRVHNDDYYIPPCASSKGGLFALNPYASKINHAGNFVEEIDNLLNIANPPMIRPFQSQWPTPFISVFSKREDAEKLLESQGEKLGEKEWIIYELSGAKIASSSGKVFKLANVRKQGVCASQFLMWRRIPQDALVASWELRAGCGGVVTRKRTTKMRRNARQNQASLSPRGQQVGNGGENQGQQLPTDRQIKAVIDHWPEKSNVTNAKHYKINWVGPFEDQWYLTEIIPEEAVDEYWEGKAKQKKKWKGAKHDDDE